MSEIQIGTIFYAYTDATTPPKVKIHVCVTDKLFFLVNTKPRKFGENLLIQVADCDFLEHDSYIAYGEVFYRNHSDFNIIKSGQLPIVIIEKLIAKVQVSLTLTPNQQKQITSSLQKTLTSSNILD